MSATLNELKITAFNKLFFEFLGDLSSAYPEDSNLKWIITTVGMASSVSPSLVPQQFMEAVEPYKEHVLNKNEAYFTSHSFAKSFQEDAYIFGEIQRIINIWKDPKTPVETKNAIWAYLTKLIKLGKTMKF